MSASGQLTSLQRSNGPLYQQVAGRLRGDIASGWLQVGAALPTEGDLAENFGVSLITVRAALRELSDEGLIRKRPAKTALVISTASRAAPSRDFRTLTELARGLAGAELVVASYRVTRSAEAARVFGLDPRRLLPCLRGVLRDADGPRSDLVVYFLPEIGARLSRADFSQPALFPVLEQRLGIEITDAEAVASVGVADAGQAMRLGCDEGAPLLVNRMVFHDASGRAVKFTIARHRAHGTSIGYQLRRR